MVSMYAMAICEGRGNLTSIVASGEGTVAREGNYDRISGEETPSW